MTPDKTNNNSSARATCLNCIDGRVQLPVLQWIRQQYNIDCVDVVTAAGMDGALAAQSNVGEIIRNVGISVDVNQSAQIFVVGHYDCKGNPVDEKTHREHVGKSVNHLKTHWPQLEITGLWVNSSWQVEVCGDSG